MEPSYSQLPALVTKHLTNLCAMRNANYSKFECEWRHARLRFIQHTLGPSLPSAPIPNPFCASISGSPPAPQQPS